MEKYYLGIRKEDNKKVYLVKESWDCGWYWGFGCIEVFHYGICDEATHFDSLFLRQDIFNSFKDYFSKTPLTDDKIWQLLGYMREYYVSEEYVELLRHGNYITSNAKNILEEKNIEENQKEIYRINKILLPELFKKIEKLFESEEK